MFLLSCSNGSKKDEITDKLKDVTSIASTISGKPGSDMAEKVNKANARHEEKMKERRAKGDTLALPYAELQKYLPESIDGYKADKPGGASINMQKISYSSADVQFKNDKGGHIKVTIIDYNQA